MKKLLTHLKYFGIGLAIVCIVALVGTGVFLLIEYWHKPATIVISILIICYFIYRLGRRIYIDVFE